jgi:hypothetical protein
MLPEYNGETREQVEAIIARAAPPVIIRGHYRFGWLPDRARKAMREHYVPITPQVWVLGARLEEGMTEVNILRAGRYMIRRKAPEPSTNEGRIVRVSTVLHLSTGQHEMPGPGLLQWLGPTAADIPAVPRLYRPLFGPVRLEGQASRD